MNEAADPGSSAEAFLIALAVEIERPAAVNGHRMRACYMVYDQFDCWFSAGRFAEADKALTLIAHQITDSDVISSVMGAARWAADRLSNRDCFIRAARTKLQPILDPAEFEDLFERLG